MSAVHARPMSALVIVLMATACDTPAPYCEPGEVQACTCASGGSGEQACLVGGGAFGTCHCDAPPPDGGVAPDGDAGASSRDASATDFCGDAPCQNGGACTSGAAGYTCACAPGFEGPRCEINIDDCVARPCQNGGSCVDGVNGFDCTCVGDYAGPICDKHRLEVEPFVYVDASRGTWSQARDAAASGEVALVEVHTPAQRANIARIARTSVEPLWIGGFQDVAAPDYSEPAGGWRWVSGAPFQYTGWNAGEPSNIGPENFLQVWGTRGPFDVGAGNDAADTDLRGAIVRSSTGNVLARDPRSGHLYAFLENATMPWSDAVTFSSGVWLGERRGHLVTIESEAEQLWLTSRLQGARHYWLGGVQDTAERTFAEPGGGWRWLNSARLGYANWATDEPSNGSATPENWMVMRPDGTWNDTIGTPYSNQGVIIEFDAETAIDYVGQQDDITRLRDGQQVFDPGADDAYGTAGYVFYCTGSGPPGGPLQFGPAAPLTYNQGGFTTLVREPTFATFHSVGQNYIVGGGANPMIDDPRGAPGNAGRVQAGLAIHNSVSLTFYETLMDFTITAPPPPVFRVGVAIAGGGEDRMAKVRLELSGAGGALAIGETAGRPATLFHFFDVRDAKVGDTFVLSAQKGAGSGTNPNVAYYGLTFD